MLAKQSPSQARINVSVVTKTSHGPVMPRIRLVVSSYLREGAILLLFFAFVGDFLFTDKTTHVRLPMGEHKSPILYIFVGDLLLKRFLSNLHIYIALCYCFFKNAKNKSC